MLQYSLTTQHTESQLLPKCTSLLMMKNRGADDTQVCIAIEDTAAISGVLSTDKQASTSSTNIRKRGTVNSSVEITSRGSKSTRPAAESSLQHFIIEAADGTYLSLAGVMMDPQTNEGDVEYHWAMTMMADVKKIRNTMRRRRVMHDLQSRILEELENEEVAPVQSLEPHLSSAMTDNQPEIVDEVKLPVDIKVEVPLEMTMDTHEEEACSVSPPTSMRFLKSINVGQHLLSITKHGNRTYAGFENHQILEITDRHDQHGNECREHKHSLVFLDGIVSSLQVYKNKLYAFCSAKSFDKIQVFSLSGETMTESGETLTASWKHNTTNRYSMIRVLSDKVVAPSETDGCLYVYTLEGDLIKKVPCPVTKGSWKTMAVCGDNSVILSDWGFNGDTVFRVNIDSGQVMWQSDHIGAPEGIVSYKDRYVLVSSYSKGTRIYILDIETGVYINEIGGEKGEMDYDADLFIYDDILMVAKYRGRSIHYYQLLTD